MKTKSKTYPYVVLLAGLPKGIAEKACKNSEKKPLVDPFTETDKSSEAVLNSFGWGLNKRGRLWVDWCEIYYQALEYENLGL